jgi:hypothetical protein
LAPASLPSSWRLPTRLILPISSTTCAPQSQLVLQKPRETLSVLVKMKRRCRSCAVLDAAAGRQRIASWRAGFPHAALGDLAVEGGVATTADIRLGAL